MFLNLLIGFCKINKLINSLRKILLYLIIMQGITSSATTYYISPYGDDNNSGTSPLIPWQTIEKVNSFNFSPGDSILFQGGQVFSGNLYFDSNDAGMLSEPVTISSYDNGRPEINASSGNALSIYNAAGFEIHNIKFSGSDNNTDDGVSVFMDLPGSVKLSYILINEVEVSGFGGWGISIGSWNGLSGFTDITVMSVESHDNCKGGIITYAENIYVNENVYIGFCKAYDNPGISGTVGNNGNGIVLGSVSGGIIEYSIAYNNGWLCTANEGPVGIWSYDSENVLIQHNESYYNKTGGSADGGGFDLDQNVRNSIMQYNYSHDNEGAGFLIWHGLNNNNCTGNIIRYNISQRDARKNGYGSILIGGKVDNTEIYNNTIFLDNSDVSIPKAIYVWDYIEVTNAHFRNNIFYTSGDVSLITVSPGATDSIDNNLFQGNCYYSSTGTLKINWGNETFTNIQAWRAATNQEVVNGNESGYEGDPLLVSPGNGTTIGNPVYFDSLVEYKLLPGSPLIESGLDLNSLFGIDPGVRDFYGNFIPVNMYYDVGAHEYSNVIILNIRVLLEGPFNGTDMDMDLNTILPLTQPYNIAPWNYTGTESVTTIPNSNVVDWILIELRETTGETSTATSDSIIAQQAAFLLNDGSIVGLDGSSDLLFNTIINDSLFVVIWHRNHLGVMSAYPLIEAGGVYTYDFTSGAEQAYGGANGHKEIGTGVWGMIGGDGNANGQIDNPDKDDVWALQAGNSGFLSGDFTMESQVNNNDKNDIWLINNGVGTQTPDNKNGEYHQLTWRFAYPKVIQGSPNLFQFDIELKCDEPGTYHTQTQIYFEYDILAFGSNINGISQNPDINERISHSHLELMDPDKYLIVNDANNTSGRYAIIIQPIDENYPIVLSNLTEVDTSYQGFLRFQIEIQDESQLAGISFSELLMDGGQYYLDIDSDTYPEKYIDPCLYPNDMINVPLFYTPESQEYVLAIGYQFLSTRIIPENQNILSICYEILDNLDFVRNTSGLMLRKIGPMWINSIGDWITTEGYLFKMNDEDGFSISGEVIDPQTPISLVEGYQFVSYLPENPMDALDVFTDVLDSLDFVRNTAGLMLRKIGPLWINGIGDLNPGEGYLVKMINPDILIYPVEGEKFTGLTNNETEYFNFEGGNAADPVYTIYFEGLEIGDEVAAYVGNNLIGAMKINSQNAFNNDLPIFSTLNIGQGFIPGQAITIKVWDNKIKKEVPVSYEFKDPYGTAHTEYHFPANDGEYSILNIAKNIEKENSISNINIYPNPSNGIFNISMERVNGDLQCKVIDLTGNEYRNFEFTGIKGFTVKQLDLKEMPAGVYFISFTGRNLSKVEKIVIN